VVVTAVLFGLLLFVLDLGSIGLVDETPPLFAASARSMVRSGDWMIPRVNGLPRYDQPPLVYWLMAGLYSLPGHLYWDPLGSWAAALPSALASTGVVLLVAVLVAWWERCFLPRPQGLWLAAALCFGLSPLVLVWSRIGVSDSLRSQPIRALALNSRHLQIGLNPIAMLGLIRPSVHFYAEAPVAYEGTSAQALVNLNHRLHTDTRVRVQRHQTRILVLAPLTLAERNLWAPHLSPLLQRQGRYGLWWLDLQRLGQRAKLLETRQDLEPTWQLPRPERF